jgi:hypothetical protein
LVVLSVVGSLMASARTPRTTRAPVRRAPARRRAAGARAAPQGADMDMDMADMASVVFGCGDGWFVDA